jgi:hypothetical protein
MNQANFEFSKSLNHAPIGNLNQSEIFTQQQKAQATAKQAAATLKPASAA